MARFVFEARVAGHESARMIQRDVEGGEIQHLATCDQYHVGGLVPDHGLEALGLRVLNLADLRDFQVNRVLATYDESYFRTGARS